MGIVFFVALRGCGPGFRAGGLLCKALLLTSGHGFSVCAGLCGCCL